jgi:hypothetical protein
MIKNALEKLKQTGTITLLFILFCFKTANGQSNTSAAFANGCYALNGMYVYGLGEDDLSILGNESKENTLLKYAKDRGFNYLLCYEIYAIIALEERGDALAAFISKARNIYGIQQIGAALNQSGHADAVVEYNRTHAINERIDVLNLEFEFWNPYTQTPAQRAAAFNNSINILNRFKTLGLANNLETEVYIGQIDATEGIRLANAVDRILVHFYRTSDVNIINYNLYRLEYLAAANKKVRIAPIFSNEGPTNTQDIPFMGTWLETHSQDQAFKTWMEGYNALNAPWKANLEIMGAQWFIYNNFMDINKTSHITSHPANQTACQGDTRTFTVASSTTNKTYYWMKNGRCLSDGGNISGAKTATLIISNISNADAATYYCRVSSADAVNPSSFASNNATLAINTSCNNVAPVVSLTSPANNAFFNAPATISIDANASDADGSIAKVEFFNGATLLNSDATAPYSFFWTNVAAGAYSITAKATDNNGAITTSAVVNVTVNTVTATQSPYSGTPANIPGTVQAENYDLGGQGVAFNDATPTNDGGAYRTTEAADVEPTTGGGFNVGYIVANEWMEYTVNVAAGNYKIDARVAAIASVNAFRVEMDGSTIATFTVPNTGGWQTWQTVTINNVALTAGQKTMRIFAVTGDFNIDNIIFSTVVVNQAPSVTLTAPANNAAYTAPASIGISADASDMDGSIAKVEFFNGTTLLNSDANAPYAFSWTNVAAGSYTITAKAFDAAGNTTTSTAVSINVNTVTTNSCTGIAQYAENGGYSAGFKVQNAGSQYECRPFPFTGWCNGAAWAYAPGTGMYWNDAWTLVGSCSAREASEQAMTSELILSNHPNPFTLQTTIEVSVIEAGPVSVMIYNKGGQALQTIVDQYLNAGKYTYVFDGNGLNADVYLIKMKNNKDVTTRKMIKME